MKRLRDEVDSNDAQLAAAGRLVEQIAPLPSSEARARRVRRAIESKGVRGRRSRLGVLFALFGLAGSAAAAFGVAEWISEPKTNKTPSGDPSEVDSGVPSEPKRDVDAPHLGAPLGKVAEKDPADKGPADKGPAESSSTKTSPDETVQVGTSQVATERASHSAQRSVTTAAATGRSAPSAPKVQDKPAPTLSEARLVKDAVEALRSGDNPEKAERLLAEYRKNSSSGHLDEEALALTIEVALAKKSPEAARHARLYLQKYPGGKFTPLAKRALQAR